MAKVIPSFMCRAWIGEGVMLKWGLVYFLLAVASGILGVMDTDGTTAVLAQIFFFGNVVLFVVFTLLGALYPQMLDLPPSESSQQSDL